MKSLCDPPLAPRETWRARLRRATGLAFLLPLLGTAARGQQFQLEAGAFNDMVPVTQSIPSSSQGLTGEYFNSLDFSGPVVLTRVDSPVDFDWGVGSPGAGVAVDNFTVRWTGFVDIPAAGAYTFQTVTDDGVRLWINGVLVLDHWQDQGPTAYAASPVDLNPGLVPIRMEYYERGVGAFAQLRWEGPGIPQAVIPSASLRAAEIQGPDGPPVTRPAIPGQSQGPNVQSVGALSAASSAQSDAALLQDRFSQGPGAAAVRIRFQSRSPPLHDGGFHHPASHPGGRDHSRRQ